MSAIKGSYYPPEIIDTDGNIENEGVYGKNTPFVSDDHMGIINLQGANIDYLKTAVDNLGSNTTALTNLINSNKSTQDAKNTAYDSHLSTLDSNTATNASNITALQTSDNDKFKTATVNNATITLTKGTGETTSLTVNNVANATNASYTTTQAATDNSTKIASTAFVRTAVANLVSSAPATLDTLNELATALGNDPNFATTVSNNIGAIDAKANTNASNITALQASDNAKFKDVSVSNDTLTFTKGDNTTTDVTVNNVANATNATNAAYASRMRWNLGSLEGKTIADLRTALMSAATSIGSGNTGYVYFSAKLSDVVSGWETTTTTLTPGDYCTVRISNVSTFSSGYFHGTIYTYDVPEYTFSVINGVWSALKRNLVQSDYDTLNSAITTTNTNISNLSSTVIANKSAQDAKNISYESRLTAVESKGYVDVEMLEEHNTDPTAHPDKLVNLTTNGNSLRAVKGNGANVDVVVPYAVGATQVNPKNLGSYATNKISDIRDLLNNELADMNTKGCSVRFVKFGADLSTIYENWAKNWDATMSPWGTIYGVMSLLGDNNYANVELVGFTGTTVLLQRSGGNWKPAETKVYTTELNNNLALHNADTTAHQPILDLIKQKADKAVVDNIVTDVDNKIQDVNTKLSQAVTTLQNGVVSSVEGKKGEINLWDLLHRYGENYVPTDTSNRGWNSLGICIIFYTQNVINNQPSQYGQLINMPASQYDESMQIWVEQYTGRMFSRGGNSGLRINDRPFVPVGI